MTIEYETFRLRKKEAFLVFIDSLQVLKVDAGDETESGGFSTQQWATKTFNLDKGDHLIQFSVESRIEPNVIKSYWET